MQLGPVDTATDTDTDTDTDTVTVSFVAASFLIRLRHSDDGKPHRFENAVKSGAFSKQYGSEGNRVVFENDWCLARKNLGESRREKSPVLAFAVTTLF